LVNESYPVITVNKPIERSLDVLEIQELMFKGKMSFTEATSKKHIINKVEKYRVEKVLNSDNKVIIRDLQNDELWIYEVKIPVVIFVRELFLDSEKSADVFLNKCRKYKRILDKKEA